MEKFSEILFQPFRDFWQWFVKFAPNLMAMLIIIIAGLILAWLIRLVMLRILRVINFDTWSDKVGLTALIRKGDVWAKPRLFWLRSLPIACCCVCDDRIRCLADKGN